MGSVKHRILHLAVGASGGVAGLFPLARCPGTICSSCFGCAGVGVGIVLIALLFNAVSSPRRKGEKVISAHPETLNGLPVLIRADRSIALQSFVQVMDAVKTAGFRQVSLQSEERP